MDGYKRACACSLGLGLGHFWRPMTRMHTTTTTTKHAGKWNQIKTRIQNASGLRPTGLDPSPSTRARSSTATDKVLSTSANLAQLLPTGSVLAYQSLSASFTNQGECYTSNLWLSLSLVTVLTASCIFFAFTDSIIYKGKVYYGVAMPRRLNLFNLSKQEESEIFAELQPDLKKRRIKSLDWVHAFFTAVVFLTIAASDVGLQKCFFPNSGADAKQLLKNLPLGMAVLSSFVFMIFPTTRKGIGSQFQGSDDCTPDDPAAGDNNNGFNCHRDKRRTKIRG